MSYFFLTPSANHKEVGVFPQSQSAHNFVDIQAKSFDLQKKIELEFEIPTPIFEKRAKLTSMLSVIPIPSWFLVLDNLLVDFISGFNLGSYQTWNLNCIHPNKVDIISNYFLFYTCNPSDNKVVNYSLSKFFIGKNTDWRFKGDSIALGNMDDYKLENEKVITYGFIKCDELVLNFSSISEDLIRLNNNPIAKGYLISERLKIELERHKFLGLEFVPVQHKDKRIKVLT